jgi:hypothetical protein
VHRQVLLLVMKLRGQVDMSAAADANVACDFADRCCMQGC